MTAKALIKEADIRRICKVAEKLGATRIKVCPDGSIDIVLKDGHVAVELPFEQPEEPKPKKKVIL